MATADKLTTIAENVPKVYNAGLASLINAMTNGGTDFTGVFASYYSGEYDEEDNPIQSPPLITIPQIDTSNGIYFRYMFYNCDSLIAIPQLDTSNGTNFDSMFYYCTSLTTIPQLDTSNGTNFSGMFGGCKSLTTIPQLDVSKGSSFYNMFGSCTSLTTISFVENCISANISFTYCKALSHDSLISILNGLKTVTSTRTCTFGATNLAKLTDEEKAIATQKNWTLAS